MSFGNTLGNLQFNNNAAEADKVRSVCWRNKLALVGELKVWMPDIGNVLQPEFFFETILIDRFKKASAISRLTSKMAPCREKTSSLKIIFVLFVVKP